jgi:plasmid replication initiation protein
MNETSPIITQSNRLITSSYSMSLSEKRVILFVLSQISPKDKDFKRYHIPIKEFSETFNLHLTNTYREVRKACLRLQDRKVVFQKDGKTISSVIVPEVITDENTHEVVISLSPSLKPYLLELKKFFTSYPINNVLDMKSAYSIRMYELMKSVKYRNKPYEITIEKLKFILNIENMYPLYSHLKQRIIEPTLREINELTDINVEYGQKKKSRKVVSLIFHIKKNPSQQMKLYLPEDNEFQTIFDTLFHQFQFSKTETNKIIREYRDPPERLEDTIKYVLDMMSKSDIKKPKPYLLKCLKDDVLKSEREKLQEEKKKKKEHEELKQLTKLWKDGKGTPEIEKQIEEFYQQVGHPLFKNWRNFV